MALDTYVCKQIKESEILVSRYKSLELMESMVIPLAGQVASSVEKRRSIVKIWVKEGKPQGSVYWFENGDIKSTKIRIDEAPPTAPDDIHTHLTSNGHSQFKSADSRLYPRRDNGPSYQLKKDTWKQYDSTDDLFNRQRKTVGSDIGDHDDMRAHLGVGPYSGKFTGL